MLSIVLVTESQLLGVVTLEEVHAGVRARSILEINHVSRLLNEWNLLPLIIQLALIKWVVLAVPHFAPFARLPISSIELLEVILVVVQAGLRGPSLIGGYLLRVGTLAANSSCVIHALLPRIIVIIILDVDLIIDVVHVLL